MKQSAPQPPMPAVVDRHEDTVIEASLIDYSMCDVNTTVITKQNSIPFSKSKCDSEAQTVRKIS